MSDLLKRKPRKIEKGVTVTPQTTFSLDELSGAAKEQVPEKKPAAEKKTAPKPPKRAVEKTTTVRVSVAMKNRMNAMVTMGIADSVDQLTDLVVDEYISNILTKDQKKQLEIIYDLYKTKNTDK